jgi:hypothetical protein
MTIALRSIIGRGDLAKERITFRVEETTDVGDYAVLQCQAVEETLTTSVIKAYWFQYFKAEKGDLVVLYTKDGEMSSKALSTGKKAHFFYWGFESPIWDDDELAAVLLRAPQWTYRLVQELI